MFRCDGLPRAVRICLLASSVLSLAGLAAVVVSDMNIRIIGIIGYAGLLPVIALLIAILLQRSAFWSRSSSTELLTFLQTEVRGPQSLATDSRRRRSPDPPDRFLGSFLDSIWPSENAKRMLCSQTTTTAVRIA